MRRSALFLGLIALFLSISCGGSGSPSTSTSTTGGNGNAPVVLQSIQISPNAAAIAPGTTQAFTANGTYSDGSTKDLTDAVQWSCLLRNLATVSNAAPTQGVATAMAPGAALITASSGTISNSAQLTIKSVSVSSLTVSPTTATIGFGNQQQFTATATFSDNSTQDVTNVSTWSVFPPFITSNSGLAIGQSVPFFSETDNVTAAFPGAIGSATLNVDLSNLVSIAIAPSNPSIANGNQLQVSVIGTFADGSTRDVTSMALWSLSDYSVATFISATTLSSYSIGSTTIMVSVGTFNASTVLNVTGAQLQSIALSPTVASLAPTTKLTLTATGLFSDSTTEDLQSGLKWSSSNPSIASVNSKGEITALSQGTTTVTVMSSAIPAIQDSATLNVSSATLNSIAVTPTTVFIVPGNSFAYTAIGTFSDGSTQDLTASASWSTKTKNVATLASNVATGQGLGQGIITAKFNSISGTGTLIVASPQQISISATPATIQTAVGTTTQLTATGMFIDGTTQDFTTLVNWTSSAPSVATVGFQTGIVSGLTEGQSTITATLGSVTATTQVTVTSGSSANVAQHSKNLRLKIAPQSLQPASF
jgi:uncharacterized protein YjdB